MSELGWAHAQQARAMIKRGRGYPPLPSNPQPKPIDDFKKADEGVDLFVEKYIQRMENSHPVCSKRIPSEYLNDVFHSYEYFCSQKSYEALGKTTFRKALEQRDFPKIPGGQFKIGNMRLIHEAFCKDFPNHNLQFKKKRR